MKILFLDNFAPFPINNGGAIRSWNFIKALAPEDELSLLCFDTTKNYVLPNKLGKYFKNIWLVRYGEDYQIKLNRLMKFSYFLRKIPWEIYDGFSEEYERMFLKILKENDFDVIFARSLSCGKYLIKHKEKLSVKTIIDLDNVDSIMVQRSMVLGKDTRYLKFRKTVNNKLLQNYYPKLNSFSASVICSQKDKDYLENLGLRNVWIIPNSLDVTYYEEIKHYERNAFNQKIIMFCGSLSYEPNIDAIKWFSKEIFPLIVAKNSQVKLYIVGVNPRREVLELAGKSVFVFPNVDSVLPYYKKSSLVVVPIRIGGGTRIKILEALACHRPVVSTSVGAEGLALKNREHCVIEDNPQKFANTCLEVIEDYKKSYRLGENGYKLVREKYDEPRLRGDIKKLF